MGCRTHKKTIRWMVLVLITRVLPSAQLSHERNAARTAERYSAVPAQTRHKHVTNPTITQANKLMMDIQQCTNLIQGNTTEDCNGAICELKHIVDVAMTAYKDDVLHKIDKDNQAIPRVASTPIDPFASNLEPLMEDPTQQITQSMQERIVRHPIQRMDRQPVLRMDGKTSTTK